MREAVIISAVRTPIGKFGGCLAPLSAVQMGSSVIAEALRRAKVAPETVDEVIEDMPQLKQLHDKLNLELIDQGTKEPND